MTLDELKASAFVVGLKETERAIDRGEAGHVFIASDCDDRISLPLRNVCAKAGISVTDDFTKKEIGRACGIKVKAASAAVLASRSHLRRKAILSEDGSVFQEIISRQINYKYPFMERRCPIADN